MPGSIAATQIKGSGHGDVCTEAIFELVPDSFGDLHVLEMVVRLILNINIKMSYYILPRRHWRQGRRLPRVVVVMNSAVADWPVEGDEEPLTIVVGKMVHPPFLGVVVPGDQGVACCSGSDEEWRFFTMQRMLAGGEGLVMTGGFLRQVDVDLYGARNLGRFPEVHIRWAVGVQVEDVGHLCHADGLQTLITGVVLDAVVVVGNNPVSVTSGGGDEVGLTVLMPWLLVSDGDKVGCIFWKDGDCYNIKTYNFL